MEPTTTTQPTNNPTGERPVFLTVLCILSFIAAGISIFTYFGAIAIAGMASAAVSNMSDDAITAYAGPSVGLIWAYIIIGFITTLIMLYGVIKMWKLQKVGFYLYTGATVVSIIMSIIYAGFALTAITAIIFGALFIVLYGLNLKHMR